MARNPSLRGELGDTELPTDRRTSQVKGDIDVSDLDTEDLDKLRDEEITNINENELSQLDTQVGIRHGTAEEGSEILPMRKLNRELQEDEDEREEQEKREVLR